MLRIQPIRISEHSPRVLQRVGIKLGHIILPHEHVPMIVRVDILVQVVLRLHLLPTSLPLGKLELPDMEMGIIL